MGEVGILAAMSAPRPDAPATGEVVELFATVVARYHAAAEEAAVAYGLTGAQARVLALLAEEPLPMRALARRLGCEPSNVTGIVDRLAARGLVERRPAPGDRRVKLAGATVEGERVAELIGAVPCFANDPFAALSDTERARLRDLLRRMLDR
jgi:DNA-binding MarR family transcriptional regulator